MKNKTEQYPKITLRQKPLANGNKTLILDCYLGSRTSVTNNEGKTRVRHHLGLHLMNETTAERKERNKVVLEYAEQLLAAKREEAIKLCDAGNFSFSKLFTVDESQTRMNTYSVSLRSRPISGERKSLYLDFYVGDSSFRFEGTIISGRQKYYMHLYLEPEKSKAAKERNKSILLVAIDFLKEAVFKLENFTFSLPKRIAVSSNLYDFL